MTLPRIPRIPRVLRFFFAALLALALPALAADPATNAPAATLEQLLAEPWRLRLSPEADPVAEMRKIATLDAFADTGSSSSAPASA